MIPLPSNYQDPHGLDFTADAVVVIHNASSSVNNSRSTSIDSDGQYVDQAGVSYSRIDFTARIYVNEAAFLDGKRGITFYNALGQDYISIEQAPTSGELVPLCEQYIQSLYP